MKELVIKDFCYISDGNYSSKYPRSDEFKESGIPFIRANNLVNGTVVSDDMYFISPEKHSELRKGHLRTDDVLITTRGNIGQTAVVPAEFHDANINAQIVLLRVDKEKILPKYLEYALHTDTVVQQIESSITGTALKQLPVGRLEKIKVKIHPKNEQEHIVSVLQKIDALTSAQKEQLETIETIVKSRFIELFGNIDECENKLELQDICLKIADGSHNPPSGVEKSQNYMISSQNIHDNIIDYKDVRYLSDSDFENENKRTAIMPGDVLLTIVGAIGRSAVVKDNLNITCQRSVCVIHPNREKVNSIFLKYMLDSISDKIINEARGAAQKGIYLNQVKKLQIICPSFDFQSQFATFVEQTDKSKLAVQQSFEKLETLKKALMQKYFG